MILLTIRLACYIIIYPQLSIIIRTLSIIIWFLKTMYSYVDSKRARNSFLYSYFKSTVVNCIESPRYYLVL